MDYKEEQKNELEALEAIYYGEVTVLSSEPHHKFTIPIKTEDYDGDSDGGLSCNLIFGYTAKYPEEAPRIEIEQTESLSEEYERKLLDYLQTQIDENLGTVMIFTLVSSAQEWLNVKWDDIKKAREEEAQKRLIREEEEEMRRFEGTRVTVESFLRWRAKFDDDMGHTKRREALERDSKKLTGRELFLRDKTMNESDLKFLDEGDAVKVDESLFQDLDDLDLDDEDDEDYRPGDSFRDSDDSMD